MPRPPRDFQVAEFRAQAEERSAAIRNGPQTAIPSRFTAVARLVEPPVHVSLWAVADNDGYGHVRVWRLEIENAEAMSAGSITTSRLRELLVDQLVKRAVKELEVPWTARPEHGEDAFEIPGDSEATVRVGLPPAGERRALPDVSVDEAATIYNDAVHAGNRAPTLAVARELDYSRSHASRLIREARRRGLIPAVRGGRKPQ
jgi:hypothetical protein